MDMKERFFSEYRENKEKEYKELLLIKQDLEVLLLLLLLIFIFNIMVIIPISPCMYVYRKFQYDLRAYKNPQV